MHYSIFYVPSTYDVKLVSASDLKLTPKPLVYSKARVILNALSCSLLLTLPAVKRYLSDFVVVSIRLLAHTRIDNSFFLCPPLPEYCHWCRTKAFTVSNRPT